MAQLGSIPESIKHETYQILPRELNLDQVVSALLRDESARLEAGCIDGQAITDILEEYREQLKSLDPQDLYDLAYEACIQNDVFDIESKAVWVDRIGAIKIFPSNLDKHLFFEKTEHLIKKAGLEFPERTKLVQVLEKVVSEGKGTVQFKGNAKLTFGKSCARFTGDNSVEIEDKDLTNLFCAYKLATSNFTAVKNEPTADFSTGL